LYYYPPDGRSVVTFPIGIAVEMPRTPLGATRIVSKHEHPIWYPPPSIREEQPDLPLAIGPGSDNPLGSFALYLGWSGYLIHGTNKPDSVGRMASHGCIHLYPEDVALLYDRVSIGTPVTVINEPVKVQWVGDVLYAEVHPSAAQALALESGESPKREQPADLAQRVRAAAATDDGGVNWGVVERVASERTGVPRAVAVRRTGASGLAD